jgi:glycosyltransferase involved in cell wall biosynthesis
MPVVIGIDASRNRSGGARAHLAGIIGAGDPARFGVSQVHVWSYQAMLDALPDTPWLVKHAPPALQRSLLSEAWWQLRSMPGAVRTAGCNILLSLDAGTIGRFQPSIVMSRDMLSFEPGEIERYGLSAMRARLILLRHMQVSSLRRASGALFLTRHAAEIIQRYSGPLPNVRIIPHGISETFRAAGMRGDWPNDKPRIQCLYVSNADMYKHQWHVIRAFGRLRAAGFPVYLRLVGGGSGRPRELLEAAAREVDPRREFVEALEAVPHAAIPQQLAAADLFVFASSCENMPNTLVEAMANGLPIACARRGPMPEILQDGGTYFDPEDDSSIAGAVQSLLEDSALRRRSAARAFELARAYSWQRCAAETWTYLADTLRAHEAHSDGTRNG